ncbi:hypothetical protein JCGZ_24199 [Jatropha curcas]|uniref:Uncharacterized protein n=1 Tax=Jatropha curcas TaxID=180498 RepID=A0A067L7T9_JATCU|nr:hypothetical protein JCGZ_24199 [Jatropha curcas]
MSYLVTFKTIINIKIATPLMKLSTSVTGCSTGFTVTKTRLIPTTRTDVSSAALGPTGSCGGGGGGGGASWCSGAIGLGIGGGLDTRRKPLLEHLASDYQMLFSYEYSYELEVNYGGIFLNDVARSGKVYVGGDVMDIGVDIDNFSMEGFRDWLQEDKRREGNEPETSFMTKK